MRKPISNQIRQRRAVSEALERQKVFISSRLYKGNGDTVSRVLVSGEYYDVGDNVLARLLNGLTPHDLGLEPAPDELGE